MAGSVERYYQKKKKRKKRAKMVFFGLLFVLMMLTLAILSVTVFFNAETIVVEGNSRYSAEEMLEVGGLKVGQNLFRLNKFKVIEQMQTLPYVKTVTIDRKLPNTLMVKVIENQPVVWVETNTGAALLNEDYRVLELLTLPPEMIPPEVTDEPIVEEEKPKEEQEKEQEGTEETPSAQPASPLAGIPRLTKITVTNLNVGQNAVVGTEDYTGFLKRLYEGFSQNPDLDWNKIREVQFFARYNVQLLYDEALTIDFGTLDQVESKIELAAYLIEANGVGQAAIIDVSNPERVYFRPQKEKTEPPEETTEEEETEIE